jgi:hypothetical protein
MCDRIQEILTGERIVETPKNSPEGERRHRLENALETFEQNRQTGGGAALLDLLSFFRCGPAYPTKNNQTLFLAFQIAAARLGCPLVMPTRELIDGFSSKADPGFCETANLREIIRRAMEEAVEAIDGALAARQSELRTAAVIPRLRIHGESLAWEKRQEKEVGAHDNRHAWRSCGNGMAAVSVASILPYRRSRTF